MICARCVYDFCVFVLSMYSIFSFNVVHMNLYCIQLAMFKWLKNYVLSVESDLHTDPTN